ncbi:DNA polymerase delta subunit 3 [Fusarium flagelliforme]|uniref:DNA polymerase delta subunit 3 n=2 Tax=Fusarium flagelliforme TaxID=2675880 RepID=A0A395M5Y4_9HYPO|nr:DNA polymerase delta subunit 3 [Fusarium flagelliforme]
MKKKRILDDQGYMVTIQEPGWESFSEDEAPPPAKKTAPAPTPSSSTGSKAKKPAPKGQGNIMSFFAKK